MSTAYELTIEAGRLVALLEDSGGVLDDESIERIDQFVEDSDDKIGASVAVIRALGSDVDRLTGIIKRYESNTKAKKLNIDRLRNNVRELLIVKLELTGKRMVKGDEFTAYLSNSDRLLTPDDPDKWPAEFVTHKTTAKLDRAALKRAIKGGEFVAGCSIVSETVFNLRK